MRWSAFSLIGVFFCPLATAEFQLGLGLGLAQLNYEEFNDRGEFQNRDSGNLDTLSLFSRWQSQNWAINFKIKNSKNVLTHESILIDSSSDTVINQAELKASHSIHLFDPVNSYLSIGLGTRDWQRDIATQTPFFGLDEDYSYNFASIGLGNVYELTERYSLELFYEYRHVTHADLSVVFLSGDFDDITFPLRPNWGSYLEASITTKITQNLDLQFNLDYEVWNFNQSNRFTLNRDGVALSTAVFEPASNSNSLGADISIIWSF